jgi:hypothetical protein
MVVHVIEDLDRTVNASAGTRRIERGVEARVSS